jgi:hypothetical protein
METTTICVTKDTRQQIEDLKIIQRETPEEVLKRVIKFYKENKN